ncbi:SUKH-4 family immunity protein [Kitasatospora sp. NPDC059571]|uniref:SUKH-4 family immunity protein n=1 Tax=Kitasatospora sp. NPDC059571 TaxID=3346871 RepID=UPI00369BABEB
MSPLIDRNAMESAFGIEELVTPDDHALDGIVDEPTRAFLREVGLPDRMGWFEADQVLLDGDLRIGGEAWRPVAEKYPNCPFDMSTWLSLGGIGLDDVSVDTVTGDVYCIPEDGAPHLLNSSIGAFAFFLHALEEERPNYDPEAGTDGVDPQGAETRLLDLMRRIDPAATENPESCWFAVLRQVRNLLPY